MKNIKRRLERLAQAIGRQHRPAFTGPRVYVYRDGAIYNKHSGELLAGYEALLEGYDVTALDDVEFVYWDGVQGGYWEVLRGFSVDAL